MEDRKLKISDDLSLPIEAVTQKLAFLGRTGSGKSYAATKLCELMLAAKAQVVALDPVGVWYGLRAGGSFSIPVFGGLHGDLPLDHHAGAMVADLIVERGLSAVLDVSQMMPGEQARFAFHFAQQFFQRKKAKPAPVHLFVEECQEFVPQNIGGGAGGFEAQMLGAFERLIKLGRNFGIGASLLSQRPQEVNKKALNQTECLFAFQMTGPQERKAIESWVSTKGGDEDIVAALPRLAVGEAHVWSPQWLRVSKTIRIAKKLTDDVSSTPKHGAKAATVRELSAMDLTALRESMAKTIEEAKANDPRELKLEISRLKKEVADGQRQAAAVQQENLKLRERPEQALNESDLGLLREARRWIGDGFRQQLEASQRRLEQVIQEATTEMRKAAFLVSKADGNMQMTRANLQSAAKGGDTPWCPWCHSWHAVPRDAVHKAALQCKAPVVLPTRGVRQDHAKISSAKGQMAEAVTVSATQQRILDALAWYESIGQDSPTVLQIGAVALIDATGGHFSNTVGPLSSNGLVVRGAGTMSLTDAGRQLARVPEQVATLAEYHDVLRQRVRRAKSGGGKTVEILDVIISRGGAEVTTKEIGEEVWIDPTGGHFSNTIGPLGTLGLVKRSAGVVRPTEIIFPPGLR